MLGRTLAHYKVVAKIGEGGMGEVYRAHDTRLGRDVALKVLPEDFAQTAQRLARFEREARLLASLNHPNIASIYGLEESAGIRCLVLELVEGETLAERLKRGALPAEEAFGIARQIAEALEAAHERAIIHRDLKPGNIKVTREGSVKVLDFGLAKALAEDAPAVGPSQSPTLSEAATQRGMVLGTAGYMSPEQARGNPVDKKADIWAFGCVLYEMLTGERAFGGDTVTDALAAVMRGEPDWSALPAQIPGGVGHLLRRCLEKEPKKRLHDIADVRLELDEAISAPPTAQPGFMARPQAAWQRLLPWALAALSALLLTALVALGWWHFGRTQTPAPRSVEKFTITLPSADELASLDAQSVALSPDGSNLVYVARHDKVTQLYLRPLDQLEAKPLAGTDDAATPFFSPDGGWIGFKPEFSLNKVSSMGGPPATISDIDGPYGATWSEDGAIILAELASGSLVEVPAEGGTPRALMEPGHSATNTLYRWPQALPGGAVLFNSSNGSNWDQARIEVFSPERGERRVLLEAGTCPHYVAPGYMVFQRDAQLMAVPFDLKSLKITGEPVPTLVHIRTDRSTGAAQFTVSKNGTLAYVPGGAVAPESRLVWVDRKGNEQPIPAPPRDYSFPRLSPDGTRVAFQIGDAFGDIWVYDLVRETLTQLTSNERNRRLAWSPGGQRIAYGLMRGNGHNVFWINADGSGEEQLTTGKGNQFPHSFSPDGRLLAYYGAGPGASDPEGIWIVPLAGDRKPQFFRRGRAPEFSPDGHWIAYALEETEPAQLYVAPYPGPGEQQPVSVNGGYDSRWSPNGREILWGWDGKVMAVSVTPAGSTLKLGKPQVLYKGDFEDVSPDGRKFLAVEPQPTTPATQINIILNWTEELKRAASTRPSP